MNSKNSSSKENSSSGSRGGRGKVYKAEYFCPGPSHKPGQNVKLLSRILATPGTKDLVPACGSSRDKGSTFCSGSWVEPGQKVPCSKSLAPWPLPQSVLSRFYIRPGTKDPSYPRRKNSETKIQNRFLTKSPFSTGELEISISSLLTRHVRGKNPTKSVSNNIIICCY